MGGVKLSRRWLYDKVQRVLHENGFPNLSSYEDRYGWYGGRLSHEDKKEGKEHVLIPTTHRYYVSDERDEWHWKCYEFDSLTWMTRAGWADRCGGQIDDPFPNYPVLNRMTKAFTDTGDRDLISVIWTSLYYHMYYDSPSRYVLNDQICEVFEDRLHHGYNPGQFRHGNDTPEFYTERLLIAPMVPGPNILRYIGPDADEDEEDGCPNRTPDNYLFLDWRRKDPYNLGFTVFLKGTDEVVAAISLYMYEDEPRIAHLQCYTREKYRGETYAEEAIEGLLGVVRRRDIVHSGYLFRMDIIDEDTPEIDLIKVEISEGNLHMKGVLDRLGFESLGVVTHTPQYEDDVDHLLEYSKETKAEG